MVKKQNPTQKVSTENMKRVENGIGKYGETFDDVFGRLLDLYEDLRGCIEANKENKTMRPQTEELKEYSRRLLSKGYHDVEEYYRDEEECEGKSGQEK